MKNILYFLFFTVMSSVVFAEGEVTAIQGQQQQTESAATATSNGGAGGAGGSGGTASSNVGDTSASIGDAANNNGNSQNITFNTPGNDIGRASDPEYVINDNHNYNTVEYKGGYEIKNVPGMASPSLTTTLSETCMGSSSGAVAVPGFGLSGGSTWTDESCVQRLDAREMRAMGMSGAAKERMCGTFENYEAFARAGVPCTARLSFEKRLKEIEEDRVNAEKPGPALNPLIY